MVIGYGSWTEQGVSLKIIRTAMAMLSPLSGTKNGKDTALEARLKKKGTALLHDTDHHGLSDGTMSDAMKTYRQALRDVPQQTGFPSINMAYDKP